MLGKFFQIKLNVFKVKIVDTNYEILRESFD